MREKFEKSVENANIDNIFGVCYADYANRLAAYFIFEKELLKMIPVEKRMDRFDAIIVEHIRSTKGRIENFSEKVGCSPSSLWRYRHRPEAFEQMPYSVLANVFRIVNVSNENLRYILGLPTGLANEKNTI